MATYTGVQFFRGHGVDCWVGMQCGLNNYSANRSSCLDVRCRHLSYTKQMTRGFSWDTQRHVTYVLRLKCQHEGEDLPECWHFNQWSIEIVSIQYRRM